MTATLDPHSKGLFGLLRGRNEPQAPEGRSGAPADSATESWLARMAAVCESAAQGDLEARVLSCDAGGDAQRLALAINHLLDITDAFVREAGACLTYSSQGKFFRKVVLRGMPGSFRNAAILINQANEAMAQNAKALSEANSQRVKLAQEMDEIVTTVASASTELQATAQSLAHTASSASEQSAQVATVSDSTSSNVQDIARATDELNQAVRLIETRVGESSQAAQRAVAEAQQSQGVIAGLASDVGKIGEFVTVISKIAKQTNLLALNATIEASRAGEAGKGFAVVASEVKELSQQTGLASVEISEKIKTVQQATDRTTKAIHGFAHTIGAINEITAQIATSVSNQRTATAGIVQNLQRAAEGAQAVSSSSEGYARNATETREAASQVLLAAEELTRMAETLRSTMTRFVSDLQK